MTLADARYLFLELNVWLCLAAALMVAATAVALSTPVTAVWPGVLLPVVLFYFIYTEERRNVSPEDPINHPRRTRLVRRYNRPLLLTELLALGLYEWLLYAELSSNARLTLPWVLFAHLPFGVLLIYAQLKRRPMFDSISVGGTWAFSIVFAVLASTRLPLSTDVVVVFLAWFVIVFAGVESRNVEDIVGDTETDQTTLAGLLGASRTRLLEVLLKGTGVLVFWVRWGFVSAAIVGVYLVWLRSFRTLTHRADQ